MKTQELIKQDLQNLMNNQGIFVTEHNATFEGEDLKIFIVMPSSLASKVDEVNEGFTYHGKIHWIETTIEVWEPTKDKEPVVTKPIKKVNKAKK